MDCQKCFTKLQRMKNTQSKIKLIKFGKKPGTTYCLGCKDFTHNFRSQEVKMTNKVFKERSNKSKLKKKTTHTHNNNKK